ncbi:MAG: hypothetical protein Ct9H300mP1_12310 [Planctomycetaceae bacterium]|nr:MAG: hypothetical protein Ct9H300mP1_12310 [Planctomycetaceae bacterium]
MIGELGRRGVDLVEVGFPYSDPIADGPVIQASYQRALESGLTVDAIFDRIGELDRESTPPWSQWSPTRSFSRERSRRICLESVAAGFSGLIVPDLPGDEAAELSTFLPGGLDCPAGCPDDPPSRLDGSWPPQRVPVLHLGCRHDGCPEAVPTELAEQLADLRSRTDLPLAVGFGISEADHVVSLKGIADGAIVGSALVRRLESIAVDGEDRAVVLDPGPGGKAQRPGRSGSFLTSPLRSRPGRDDDSLGDPIDRIGAYSICRIGRQNHL